ncbi:hypothetical protein [Clostridium estertheticum]|uniref:hypothetical protein n=1 Tax=Clostridium estertheticum TaxID=238834 RepID=UPI001C0DF6B7|nr:hypothetical protein [Clostridium estertheticum]MBU3186586.1 hypothetical protein [Clostridium estertheticum]
MEDKCLKKVLAYYRPKDTSDLRPECTEYIGKLLEFQYSWLMDEDDRWEGVWALTPTNMKFGWSPEFDLEIIEEVS